MSCEESCGKQLVVILQVDYGVMEIYTRSGRAAYLEDMLKMSGGGGGGGKGREVQFEMSLRQWLVSGW
jgi:hypothetical protein